MADHPPPRPPAVMETDPFDTVLDLEEQYYEEGFQEGLVVGSRAGFWEAYVLGVERGFDKFLQVGLLRGRVAVWNSRSQSKRTSQGQKPSGHESEVIDKPNASPSFLTTLSSVTNGSETGAAELSNDKETCPLSLTPFPPAISLPPVSSTDRIDRHISTILSLVQPEKLSVINTDDEVDNADDRLRRGLAKAKLIERILDERFDPIFDSLQNDHPPGDTNLHNKTGLTVRNTISGEQNIEDFGF